MRYIGCPPANRATVDMDSNALSGLAESNLRSILELWRLLGCPSKCPL